MCWYMRVSTSFEQRKNQWNQIRDVLRKYFPDRKSELNYSTPWELLLAVILSAQCTDDQVNRVTEKLFQKYPHFEDYLSADIHEFERDIYSTGFFRSKARHVLGSARQIAERFGGIVPNTMEELITLPGVARKTANVVLQNIFDRMDGIAVDTHVRRFALRFGLSESQNPDHIERDLMRVIAQDEWMIAGYWIKEHGRKYGKSAKMGYKPENDPLLGVFVVDTSV
jgi:endonuclease-3